jgi:hypothetical protein
VKIRVGEIENKKVRLFLTRNFFFVSSSFDTLPLTFLFLPSYLHASYLTPSLLFFSPTVSLSSSLLSHLVLLLIFGYFSSTRTLTVWVLIFLLSHLAVFQNDVFFVVFCVALACVIGIAICCCLPCIIALFYAVADRVEFILLSSCVFLFHCHKYLSITRYCLPLKKKK